MINETFAKRDIIKRRKFASYIAIWRRDGREERWEGELTRRMTLSRGKTCSEVPAAANDSLHVPGKEGAPKSARPDVAEGLIRLTATGLKKRR